MACVYGCVLVSATVSLIVVMRSEVLVVLALVWLSVALRLIEAWMHGRLSAMPIVSLKFSVPSIGRFRLRNTVRKVL